MTLLRQTGLPFGATICMAFTMQVDTLACRPEVIVCGLIFLQVLEGALRPVSIAQDSMIDLGRRFKFGFSRA